MKLYATVNFSRLLEMGPKPILVAETGPLLIPQYYHGLIYIDCIKNYIVSN